MTHCPIGQIAHGESSYGTAHWFIHLVLRIVYHAWGSHPTRHHVHAHDHVLLPSRSIQVHCLVQIQLGAPCALSSLDSFTVGVIDCLTEGTYMFQMRFVSCTSCRWCPSMSGDGIGLHLMVDNELVKGSVGLDGMVEASYVP